MHDYRSKVALYIGPFIRHKPENGGQLAGLVSALNISLYYSISNYFNSNRAGSSLPQLYQG
ncbi:hypothetical protein [Pedobacter sp. R20-19]|uniref:hypothetical protein n=1 Tax=Pedobacter sp. R20-19 TaxID=1270196 RepID=UPI0004939F10|nr:hypothetical protein [Pedobacter sp. R20-19]